MRTNYMVVTADEFELPLTPPMHANELKRLGISDGSIYKRVNDSTFCSAFRFNGEHYRVVKVGKEDLE